eukprot:g4013.t1
MCYFYKFPALVETPSSLRKCVMAGHVFIACACVPLGLCLATLLVLWVSKRKAPSLFYPCDWLVLCISFFTVLQVVAALVWVLAANEGYPLNLIHLVFDIVSGLLVVWLHLARGGSLLPPRHYTAMDSGLFLVGLAHLTWYLFHSVAGLAGDVKRHGRAGPVLLPNNGLAEPVILLNGLAVCQGCLSLAVLCLVFRGGVGEGTVKESGQQQEGQMVEFQPFASDQQGQAVEFQPFASAQQGQAVEFQPFASAQQGQAVEFQPFASALQPAPPTSRGQRQQAVEFEPSASQGQRQQAVEFEMLREPEQAWAEEERELRKEEQELRQAEQALLREDKQQASEQGHTSRPISPEIEIEGICVKKLNQGFVYSLFMFAYIFTWVYQIALKSVVQCDQLVQQMATMNHTTQVWMFSFGQPMLFMFLMRALHGYLSLAIQQSSEVIEVDEHYHELLEEGENADPGQQVLSSSEMCAPVFVCGFIIGSEFWARSAVPVSTWGGLQLWNEVIPVSIQCCSAFVTICILGRSYWRQANDTFDLKELGPLACCNHISFCFGHISFCFNYISFYFFVWLGSLAYGVENLLDSAMKDESSPGHHRGYMYILRDVFTLLLLLVLGLSVIHQPQQAKECLKRFRAWLVPILVAWVFLLWSEEIHHLDNLYQTSQKLSNERVDEYNEQLTMPCPRDAHYEYQEFLPALFPLLSEMIVHAVETIARAH